MWKQASLYKTDAPTEEFPQTRGAFDERVGKSGFLPQAKPKPRKKDKIASLPWNTSPSITGPLLHERPKHQLGRNYEAIDPLQLALWSKTHCSRKQSLQFRPNGNKIIVYQKTP
jgi:hypothetical protein